MLLAFTSNIPQISARASGVISCSARPYSSSHPPRPASHGVLPASLQGPFPLVPIPAALHGIPHPILHIVDAVSMETNAAILAGLTAGGALRAEGLVVCFPVVLNSGTNKNRLGERASGGFPGTQTTFHPASSRLCDGVSSKGGCSLAGGSMSFN